MFTILLASAFLQPNRPANIQQMVINSLEECRTSSCSLVAKDSGCSENTAEAAQASSSLLQTVLTHPQPFKFCLTTPKHNQQVETEQTRLTVETKWMEGKWSVINKLGLCFNIIPIHYFLQSCRPFSAWYFVVNVFPKLKCYYIRVWFFLCNPVICCIC